VKSNSAGRRSVWTSLDERRDGTTWTLNGHWNLRLVGVQSCWVVESSLVDRVPGQGDNRVATHSAVALVVHEDYRQICVACTWSAQRWRYDKLLCLRL